MAYHAGAVSLHAKIHVRLNGERIETTPGRVFFNEVLPEEAGYYNQLVDRKTLGRLVDTLYRRFGSTRTAEALDAIKRLGFRSPPVRAPRSASWTLRFQKRKRASFKRRKSRSYRSRSSTVAAC